MESIIYDPAVQSWTDEEIIRRVVLGETRLYELLVRRYNQRVYRAIRGVLKDDFETEDVMQEAHVAAFQHLSDFEGRSSYSTWLTKIAIRKALERLPKMQRFEATDFTDFEESDPKDPTMSPESFTASREARDLLEDCIMSLPVHYRSVVMMRDVEEMSTEDTANALDVTEETVKVRLHRARALLRKELFTRVGATSTEAFQFQAPRCNRVTEAVMDRIAAYLDQQ